MIGNLSDAVGVSPNVFFNGMGAYLLDQSSLTRCKGDSAGDGKGVRSGTVNGACKPESASTTVKANGKFVVRIGDSERMQGGNCIGVHTAQPAPAGTILGGMCTQSTCPPVEPETPQEKGKFWKWLDEVGNQIKQAVKQPMDGLIGAGKGFANIPSDLLETIGKGILQSGAARTQVDGYIMEALGAPLAKGMQETANDLRQCADNVNVPKLKMANDAQEGGDKIATILLVLGSGGPAKGGAKGLSRRTGKGASRFKAEKPTKAASAARDADKTLAGEDAAKVGTEAGEVTKAGKGIQSPGGGLSIEGAGMPPIQPAKLDELIGQRIASGHSFEKHVVKGEEFKDLGIATREQFSGHIEQIVNNPSATKQLSGGRTAFWDNNSKTVVISNPKAVDGGTAFRPKNGKTYFESLR